QPCTVLSAVLRGIFSLGPPFAGVTEARGALGVRGRRHPTLALPRRGGGKLRGRAIQRGGLRPLPCTGGTPPDGRGQPLGARVRLQNRQAWRKDSACESGSQQAGSADWESHR